MGSLARGCCQSQLLMMLLWDLAVLMRCCGSHSFMEVVLEAVVLGRCCESQLEHCVMRVSRLRRLFWVQMLHGDVV